MLWVSGSTKREVDRKATFEISCTCTRTAAIVGSIIDPRLDNSAYSTEQGKQWNLIVDTIAIVIWSELVPARPVWLQRANQCVREWTYTRPVRTWSRSPEIRHNHKCSIYRRGLMQCTGARSAPTQVALKLHANGTSTYVHEKTPSYATYTSISRSRSWSS
jgi:hypothetical protein